MDGPDHGVLQIDVPWARDGADVPFLFASFARTLVREMPVKKVSPIIQVDDHKLWRRMHHDTEAARQEEDCSTVSTIGVEETSKAKGHEDISLLVDLAKKRTIFVAQGKRSETIAAFTEDFRGHHGHPQAMTDIARDMSPAFLEGVEENLPRAAITFDPYPILKILHTAVDAVRRAEGKHQELLRGPKYLSRKNQQNLTEAQRQILASLESMPRLHPKTLSAYHIRENFQAISQEETRESFERTLRRLGNP